MGYNSLLRRVFLFVAMRMLAGLAKSTVIVQDIAQLLFNISVVSHALRASEDCPIFPRLCFGSASVRLRSSAIEAPGWPPRSLHGPKGVGQDPKGCHELRAIKAQEPSLG